MPRLRTANYPEGKRKRLGDAVIEAREADGYKFRPSFAAAAGVSLRSLTALELGEPTVGATTLRAVGRTLSTWTADTPQSVLEGGPIPPTAQLAAPPIDPEERAIYDSLFPLSHEERMQTIAVVMEQRRHRGTGT